MEFEFINKYDDDIKKVIKKVLCFSKLTTIIYLFISSLICGFIYIISDSFGSLFGWLSFSLFIITIAIFGLRIFSLYRFKKSVNYVKELNGSTIKLFDDHIFIKSADGVAVMNLKYDCFTLCEDMDDYLVLTTWSSNIYVISKRSLNNIDILNSLKEKLVHTNSVTKPKELKEVNMNNKYLKEVNTRSYDFEYKCDEKHVDFQHTIYTSRLINKKAMIILYMVFIISLVILTGLFILYSKDLMKVFEILISYSIGLFILSGFISLVIIISTAKEEKKLNNKLMIVTIDLYEDYCEMSINKVLEFHLLKYPYKTIENLEVNDKVLSFKVADSKVIIDRCYITNKDFVNNLVSNVQKQKI